MSRYPPPCLIVGDDAKPTLADQPDPTCSTGIQNKDACCAIECGSCSGSGCGSRPGEASSCCHFDIVERNKDRTCDEYPPPCLIVGGDDVTDAPIDRVTGAPTSKPTVVPETAAAVCKADAVRNLVIEGATIEAVSSNYGTTPDNIDSNWGAANAIDGLNDTAWSSYTDGDNATISIRLPYPANVEYVEFHTRFMTDGTAIISEYQVEIGDEVVAFNCTLPDYSQPYICELDHPTKNVTVITFRATKTSAGNTGAVDIGVYGCSVGEAPEEVEESPTVDEKPADTQPEPALTESAGVLPEVVYSVLMSVFSIFLLLPI